MAEVFETADLARAMHVLSDNYAKLRLDGHGGQGHNGQRHDGQGHDGQGRCGQAGLRLAQTSLTPAIRFDHLRLTMSFEAEVAPLGALIFAEFRHGVAAYSTGGRERRYGPGQVHLTAQPECGYQAAIRNLDAEMVVIDPGLLGQVADAAPGRREQPVRFTGYEPVSAGAARAWKDAYAYVRDTVLASPEAAAQPLLTASAARLLIAVTLNTFPHTAVTDPSSADRQDAHSETLRRAIAFIDDYAHTPITPADIAAAAGVTIRAVQLAFRRHLDTTPTAYLRRVRLEHARRDLAAADPSVTTVAVVAHRWGFPSPSRFTAYYRQAYGVPPGRTLRRG